MRHIASRLNTAERFLYRDRGICPHLPFIIEWRDENDHPIAAPNVDARWERKRDRRNGGPPMPDDAVCPCGRERLKIIFELEDVPPGGRPVED